ncbi:MAG: hypothetical protein V1725_08220 [archaeon]
MPLNITALSKRCRAFVKEYPAVQDIILYGSVRKGKGAPADTDILLLFDGRIDKDVEYAFRKAVVVPNLAVVSKTSMDDTFPAREGILFEGYSLVYRQAICSRYGFSPFGFFLYDTGQLSNTMRTRFYYALNGRSREGVAKRLRMMKLSANVLAVPLPHLEEAKAFLVAWKLPFVFVPMLIPERLARKDLLVIPNNKK